MRKVLKCSALNKWKIYCRTNLQPFHLTDSPYVILSLCSLSKTTHCFWNYCPSLCLTWGLFLHCGLQPSALSHGSRSVLQWGHMPPLCSLATFGSSEHSPLGAKPKLVTFVCKTFHRLRARVCHLNGGVLGLRTEVTPLKPVRSMHT